MNLQLDYSIGTRYRSKSQQMRVITENWVAENSFCPVCGQENISRYRANKPVADFFCQNCHADFELKSKELATANIPKKISDGAYDTMISRLNSNSNPHFFFLLHHEEVIRHFFLVPKFFLTPDYIQKRPPLPPTARRAGWVGCNIDLSGVPRTGVIFLIRNEKTEPKEIVLEQMVRVQQIRESSMKKRGWLLEVLKCVEAMPKPEFSLKEVYASAEQLSLKYPQNRFVEAKIRQQLQILRDKGFIEFSGRGQYRKKETTNGSV